MKKQLWLITLVFNMFFNSLSAQIQVTDLTRKDSDKNSNPRDFVQFNNLFFFKTTTESYGWEIWVSDGTAENTRLLKDIYPGNGNGIITSFTQSSVILNNKLFFTADDGQNGKQIWATDGTEDGTVRITNLPGLNISKLTLVGSHFYFLVNEKNLLHLWKSDGTGNGTTLVKGDLPGWNSPTFEGTANNLFFFTFQPEGTNRCRVWRSDGTESGTFPITPEVDGNGAGPSGTSSLTQYIEFNNNLYFVLRSSSIFSSPTSVGIMKTDGSLANTIPVKAVHEGNIDLIDFADVIEINDKLYFSFFQLDKKRLFIWESDGTWAGTKKIYDVNAPEYYIPSNLSTNGIDLIFTGKSNNDETALLKLNLNNYEVEEIKELMVDPSEPLTVHSYRINLINKVADNSFHISTPKPFGDDGGWISDLTMSNTVLIEELKNVREIIAYEGDIYFSGRSEQTGYELWKSDNTFDNPGLLQNINTSKFGLASWYYIVLDDKIFFRANDGITGEELWVYNNSTGETYLVRDIQDGAKSSFPSHIARYNNHLYFRAFSEGKGYELWRTDGSENGTVMVSDLNEGANSSVPDYLVSGLDKLFFIAFVNGHYSLCKVDEAGVELIKDFGANDYGVPFRVVEMVSSDKSLYFTLQGAKESLWKSDGTEMGTIKIKELSAISNLTILNEKVYFSASESYLGETELWQSDGTDAGTKIVKDIGTGYSSNPGNFKPFNEQLIFTAYSQEFGREYWKSDGTVAGTIQIADINPGNSGSVNETSYAELDGLLYFTANDGSHGNELWKTDGTPEGTTMVKDINEGADGSFPKSLISDGKAIYFSAYSAESGTELWFSEGTESSTKQLYDVLEGLIGSNPSDFTFLNDDLFFVAETSNSGRQLWKASPDMITSIDNFDRSERFEIFPNPTSDYLNFNSEEFNTKDVVIINTAGQKMIAGKINNNKVHLSNLAPGIYILITGSEDKKVTRRFIKQ